MGLDWFVQPKMENGRSVMPHEAAGRILLDRDDPVSIEIFEKTYKLEKKNNPDPGAPPVAPRRLADSRGAGR